jgi:hypothetical protein
VSQKNRRTSCCEGVNMGPILLGHAHQGVSAVAKLRLYGAVP